MPSKKQKTVTIRLDLYEGVKADYEADISGWGAKGVRSTTGLIQHYIKEGREEGNSEINMKICHEVGEPYQVVTWENCLKCKIVSCVIYRLVRPFKIDKVGVHKK